MLEFLADVLIDAIRDTLVLVPFLFVTYLVLEALEHVAGERVNAAVRRAGSAGPALGAILGIVPQCGFSAMGATLYAGRVVTLGTLVAVFLSTSDEMLPLLVAERPDLRLVAGILAAKAVLALVVGFGIDAALSSLRRRPRVHAGLRRGVLGAVPSLVDRISDAGAGASHIHELCEREHCHCDDDHGEPHDEHNGDGASRNAHEHGGGGIATSVLRGAITHTVQVTGFVFLVTLVLAWMLASVGEGALAAALSGNEVLAVLVSALVGLIPNCAASVVITQLFLEGALAFGPMMAGTLVAAGAGFLVLFRTNPNVRENLAILALIWLIGLFCGLLLVACGF